MIVALAPGYKDTWNTSRPHPRCPANPTPQKPPLTIDLTDLLFFHDMSGDTYNLVQTRYGSIAKYSDNTQSSEVEENIARAFGYTAGDLSALPEKANLGLSCGNPVGFANLKEVWLCYLVPRAPTNRF